MEWVGSIRECLKEGTLPSVPEERIRPEQSIFPARRHPNYTALRDSLYASAESYGSLQPRELMRINGMSLFACYMWPNSTDEQRSLTLLKLMQWFCLVDDVVDELSGLQGEVKQVERLCKRVIGEVIGAEVEGNGRRPWTEVGGSGREKEAIIVAKGLEWWREMQAGISAKQKSRFAKTFIKYLLAQVDITRLRQELMTTNDTLPPTIQDYTVVRRVASGFSAIVTMAEYDLGIELDQQALTSPLLQQLHVAVCDHASWLNDIISFPREFVQEDFLSLLPLLHLHNHPLPFHHTLSQAWCMTNARELDCARLAQQLLHSPNHASLVAKSGLQTYVDTMCNVTSGNFEWSLQVPRYNPTSPMITSLASTSRVAKGPLFHPATRKRPSCLSLTNPFLHVHYSPLNPSKATTHTHFVSVTSSRLTTFIVGSHPKMLVLL